MAPSTAKIALAVAGLAVAASAQPAPGLAPLSPQLPAGLMDLPDLPPNAPRALVRAVEAARADPASVPAYAPALIKSATTPVTLLTKEEHKAEWEKVQAEWAAEHPDGYKGMEKAGRRLAGAKGCGEAEDGTIYTIGKKGKCGEADDGTLFWTKKGNEGKGKKKGAKYGEAEDGTLYRVAGRRLAGAKGCGEAEDGTLYTIGKKGKCGEADDGTLYWTKKGKKGTK